MASDTACLSYKIHIYSKELLFESMQKFPLHALLRAKGLKLSVSCIVVPFAMFNFPSSKNWLQGGGKVGEARQSRNEPDIFFSDPPSWK